MMKGCIVLIVGLPASGKSTFATQLVNYININHDDMKPLYLDFDKVIPLEEQMLIVNQLDSSWKETRRHFVSSCQAFLHKLLNSPNSVSSSGSMPMNEIKYLEEIINQMPMENVENFDSFCFIVEDNFYYKSMREQFFRLSKQFRLGFLLITINTPFDSCLRRNEIRSNSVDEKIIKRMANCFERPTRDEFGVQAGDRIQLMVIDCYEAESKDKHCDEAVTFIKKAWDNPIESKAEDHNQQDSREVCRRVTADNLVHRFDKLLRLSVNKMMMDPQVVNRSMGKELSSIRKKLLKRFSDNQLDPVFGDTLIKEETPNQRLMQMALNLIELEMEERKTLIVGGSGHEDFI